MRLFLITLLIAALLGSLIMGVPKETIAGLSDGDPELQRAITLAEQGDDSSLETWLIGQDDPIKQAYATAVRRLVTHEGDLGAEDRAAGMHRHLMRPFLTVSTGKEALDLELINNTIYALTACSEGPPDPEDLKRITPNLLTKLEKAIGSPTNSKGFIKATTYADTLGCAYFALGDMDKASMWFEKSIRYLDDSEVENDTTRALRTLLTARHKATMDTNINRLPRAWEVLPSKAAEDGKGAESKAGENTEEKPLSPSTTAPAGVNG